MKFKILGKPMAKQSARFAKRGNFMQKYQPAHILNWANDCKQQIREQLPEGWKLLDSEIKIKSLTFNFPPLKSWSKKKLKALKDGEVMYKETKPDLDNLIKQTWDSCNGLVWTDDARIVQIDKVVKKFDEVPCTIIEIGDE